MEREKERERKTSCEYERESCPKIIKKWLSKYHFSTKKAYRIHFKQQKHGKYFSDINVTVPLNPNHTKVTLMCVVWPRCSP
jgi:hypothetical protein